MGLKNKSMYAILGILNLSPSSGYDIKKYSDKVLSGFWNENFGHIYPTLKMLLEEGMIEAVTEKLPQTEKPLAKIRYRITEKGKQELQQWLLEETIQQPVRSEFMLKLLFSSDQPKTRVISMLDAYQMQYESRIENYKEMLSKLEGEDSEISGDRALFLRAVLRRGIISDEAVIHWCKETKELFGRQG